ncbi:MAG: adenosylcobinamide kinase/adenosylcobinamide-phosphate guanylyltransferase [Oceanospirillaceae bacterium]|jgi:adenosylcobinamide kinase/adenosylcobinamide-phosphate guanylyltransferase
MIELYLGGTRSGKSKLAEQAALESGLCVVYIATATSGDGQMQQRIEQHRVRRPSAWQLVEEPLYLADIIAKHSAPNTCLLVDCLTLWLTNCLFSKDTDFYLAQKKHLLAVLENLAGQVIFVSNETNMGVIPMGEMSREFCDQAGLLHQELAAISHKVTLAVAGLAHVLKDQKSE